MQNSVENHKNLSDFLRQLLYMTIKMFKKAKKVSHSNPFDCYGFKNGNLDKQKSRAARETQIKSSGETSLLLFIFYCALAVFGVSCFSPWVKSNFRKMGVTIDEIRISKITGVK